MSEQTARRVARIAAWARSISCKEEPSSYGYWADGFDGGWAACEAYLVAEERLAAEAHGDDALSAAGEGVAMSEHVAREAAWGNFLQQNPFRNYPEYHAVWNAAWAACEARIQATLQAHRLMGVRHVGNLQYRASCTCGHICTQDVDWFGAVENWQLHLHEAVRAAGEGQDD